ncbi:U2 small nuclear ribonucleoprotein auxiliary factor 35 kDa subunit-related protein 1 isoform X1 [Frieseomelitta varia]|uniref:U2 small nuclear ribonucleoprotein auxiliary factor 35 kDa subunit-related protein 1 isoform X1 n=1 Tax=Frieseomelitta varia TaxID=561572 RepID=UPI001CB6B052|nr:U2 small nuclear ribonucleoprotein auxiliary factor 35 kDa subunit-related protein 1 isoform X1 [Frieseomelitta varia]
MVMEGDRSTKKSHKEWRKIAKKERRRHLRRRAAAEREADEQRLRAALEKSADYLNWLEQREAEEREKEAREKEEHDERERLWLEEEVKAQEEWQILQEKKQKARQLQLEQEAKVRQEFEAKQEAVRKKQEEEKRRREEEIRKREQLLKEIDDYIDNGIKTPEALREVIDSQPGKELCPFFTKTGACRYGDTCSRNHRRLCLSKVILVPGFYTHFSLEKNSAEYDTDIGLEFESSETRQHFREFYNDVVPELESFGRIKTLKYCCNTEVHLRGNLYVEYHTEREAARALRKLKGRWYAGRQLNCEFVNLKSWRSAVCGMSKCPKGRACNFLHTFKNPHDQYDIKSPPRWMKQLSSSAQEITSNKKLEHRNKSKWEDDTEGDKNWRWSESPEPEIDHRSRNTEKRHYHSDERERDFRQRSARDKRHEQVDRDAAADNESPSVKRHRAKSRRYKDDEKMKDDDVPNDRESCKSSRHSKKHQRKRKEDSDVSPKRSRKKRRSKSSERNHRSISHRFSNKYSRSEKTESVDKDRHKLKSHNELCQDPWRCGTKDARTKEICVDAMNGKSKWDKENSEKVDSEGTESSDSEISGVVEDQKDIDKSETPCQRSSEKVSDNEWTTTDSEDDVNIKKN